MHTDAVDSHHAQPIQLRKLPRSALYEGFVFSCESAYYNPLVQATKVSTEDRIFENRAYTEIRSKYGRTFQLPDTYPQASRINAFNKRWLNLQLVGSHGCDLSASHAVKWFNSQKPVVWTNQWLVAKAVQDYTYCGGAHGDSYTEVTVFDLDLGKPIDTWRWIKGGQASANPIGGEASRLRKLLQRHAVRLALPKILDNATITPDMADGSYASAPYPTKKGMLFPSVLPACRGLECHFDILIPYAALRPYLSPEGKGVAEQFQQGP